MQDSNWYKVHRNIEADGYFDRNPLKNQQICLIYKFLLSRAAWVDSQALNRGQCILTLGDIYKNNLVIPDSRIRYILNSLRTIGMIAMKRVSNWNNAGWVFTLLQYHLQVCQDIEFIYNDGKTDNKQLTNSEHTLLKELGKIKVLNNKQITNSETIEKNKELRKENTLVSDSLDTPKPKRRLSPKAEKTASEGSKLWDLFALKWAQHYNGHLIRGAKENKLCKDLAEKLENQNIELILENFFSSQKPYYVQNSHRFDILYFNINEFTSSNGKFSQYPERIITL